MGTAARDLLKELAQKVTVDTGRGRQDVEAKFDREINETRIDAIAPEPALHLVEPGLVLLQLMTDRGQLQIVY